jgi:hypothetical protein
MLDGIHLSPISGFPKNCGKWATGTVVSSSLHHVKVSPDGKQAGNNDYLFNQW